uniref:Uncharacterized protein n=1 Tax=Eutreptiella gymnastica TaxID=73025 RepID=A0A7S4CVV2_9EUGL
MCDNVLCEACTGIPVPVAASDGVLDFAEEVPEVPEVPGVRGVPGMEKSKEDFRPQKVGPPVEFHITERVAVGATFTISRSVNYGMGEDWRVLKAGYGDQHIELVVDAPAPAAAAADENVVHVVSYGGDNQWTQGVRGVSEGVAVLYLVKEWRGDDEQFATIKVLVGGAVDGPILAGEVLPAPQVTGLDPETAGLRQFMGGEHCVPEGSPQGPM